MVATAVETLVDAPCAHRIVDESMMRLGRACSVQHDRSPLRPDGRGAQRSAAPWHPIGPIDVVSPLARLPERTTRRHVQAHATTVPQERDSKQLANNATGRAEQQEGRRSTLTTR